MSVEALDRLARAETKVESHGSILDRIENRLHSVERNLWTGIGILGALQFVAAWVMTRL